MQTQLFTKTKIALAVGTALMAMAGTAQAAAPALRATAPEVVTAISASTDAKIFSLLSTTGLSGSSVTVSVNLTSAVTTAGITGDIAVVQGSVLGAGGVNSGAAVTLDVNAGTLSDVANNVNAYTGTLSSSTALAVTSATFIPDAQTTKSSGKAAINVVLTAPVAPAAYRINAGNLEYTSNNGSTGGTAVAFAPVNIDVTSSAAASTGATDRIIYTEEGTAAGYVNATDLVPATLTVTGTVKNALVPTPKIATRSTAGQALIDGVTIDTGAPLTFVAANLLLKTTANAPVIANTDITAKMTVGTPAGSIQPLTFTAPGTLGATGIGWVSGTTTATASDVAAYASTAFNTGVAGATVPVNVDGTATAASYGTQVVNAGDGGTVKLDDSAGTSKAVATAAKNAAIVAQACVAAQGALLSAAGTGAAASAAAEEALVDGIAAPVLNTPAACTTAAAVALAVTADTAVKAVTGGATAAATEVLVEAAIVAQNVTQDTSVATTTIAEAAFPAKFAAPAGNVIIDGAAPVIVPTSGITFSAPSTATVPLTNVGVTFSEDMSLIGGDDLREVLENIFVGAVDSTTTLAALSLNSFGVTAPTLAGFTLSAGQDTLTINNISATDVATLSGGIWTGKSMSVGRGISFQEVNDHDYTANLVSGAFYDEDSPGAPFGANGEELSGGVKSASGVVEAIPATRVAQVATAPVPSVVWGTDTSALASASSAASPDLIDTITVTFPAGKGVKYAPAGTVFGSAAALASAKTATDLANNLVVDVFGSNGIRFQVKPLSATLDTANQITVKIPTAFIYNKLTNSGAQLKSVWVGYVADGNGQQNNTLVATDAASTLTSPIRVQQGLIGNSASSLAGTGWVTADLTAAGAEPVVLPLVFTAVQTGNQSTLLTQNIQSNIVGSAAGSIVKAYLAYWVDLPKQSIVVGAADLKSGRITNPGDKVATDLAIEFADSAALATLIQTELQAVKPKQEPKPGVQAAEGPIPAKDITVYVKLVRSNDTANANAQTTSQNYLNARAILGSTYAVAKAAAETTIDTQSPIYEVLLNPVTGEIKGRLTGNIVIKPSSSTGNRGLRFLDMNGKDTATATVHGSSIVAQKSATGLALPTPPVTTPASFGLNLLMGIDPLTTDFGAITALNPFVLLTHQDSTGKYTLLTSADPTASNYLPFAPDVMNRATGTGGIAVRATAPLSVTDVWAFDIPVSANWALYGFGNPATKAVATGPASAASASAASASGPAVSPDKAFPRMFVGLNTVTGAPESFWTADGVGALPIAKQGDIALSIAGNNVGVATELTSDTGNLTGPTLSNIGGVNQVKGAVAVGWSDERGATDGATAKLGKIYVAQASGPFAPAVAAPAPKVKKGWSLVTVPGTRGSTGTLSSATIDAVIKVGAQVGLTGTTLTAQGTGSGAGVGQFSWFAVDGAMPTMTAGDAVFVHAKIDGSL